MNKEAMKDAMYEMLSVRVDSLVEIGKKCGLTWEDFEQMLHDSMKMHNISTGEEAKQWYTYTS